MVRTYAFNPSMQSRLAADGSTSTPPDPVTSFPALPVLHSAAVQRHPPREMAMVDFPPIIQPQRQPFPPPHHHQQRGRHSPQANGPPSLDSLVSASSILSSSHPASSIHNAAASTSSSSSTAVIQEEQTSIFSIRSVLINGQRFFQPLELPASHQTQFQQQQDVHPPLPLPSNNSLHPALLAIGATTAPNGRASMQTEPRQQQNGHGKHNNFGAEKARREAEEEAMEMQRQQQEMMRNGRSRMMEHSDNGRVAQTKPNANLLIPRSTTMFGIGGAGGFNEEGEGGLPWARGNPQPKNGLRGSRDWQASQQRTGAGGFDQSYGSSTLSWPMGNSEFQQRTEQERHRLELLQQIEENRARKARERQREWEAEERQRIRDELWQQRQRLEMEEERRKEHEKALMAELKAAKLAQARRATEETLMREAKLRKEAERMARGIGGGGGGGSRRRMKEEEEEEEAMMREEANNGGVEEWWEKKDRKRAEAEAAARRGGGGRAQAQSPAVPAIQKRRMNGGREDGKTSRSLSVGSRKESGGGEGGRQSRFGYTPSVASRKSSSTLDGRNGGGRQFNGDQREEQLAGNGTKNREGSRRRTRDFDI